MTLIIRGPLQHFEKSIQWLEVTTTYGSLIIQEGHAPLLALAHAQDVIFQTHQEFIETFTITSSIIEVNRSTITVLMS